MSIATRLRKLEAKSTGRLTERVHRATIRYWIDFVIYCTGGPEAEQRFGETLRTGPIFHPQIKPFFDMLDNESEKTP